MNPQRELGRGLILGNEPGAHQQLGWGDRYFAVVGFFDEPIVHGLGCSRSRLRPESRSRLDPVLRAPPAAGDLDVILEPLAAVLLLMNTGGDVAQPSLAMKPIDCFPAALCTGNVGSPGRRVESWVESAILRQSRGRLAVTTPSNVLALLKESGMSATEARQSCQDDECVQEIMGALDINYLLGTEFYTVGSGFEVSLKLWSGERSLATEMVSADRLEDLRDGLAPVVKTVLSSIFVPDRPVTMFVPETAKADAESKRRLLAAEAERQERLAQAAEKAQQVEEANRRRALAAAAQKKEREEAKERKRLAAEAARRSATEGLPGVGFGHLWTNNFDRKVSLQPDDAWIQLKAARYLKEKNASISVGLWVEIGAGKTPFTYTLDQFVLLDQNLKRKRPRFFPALTQLPASNPDVLQSATIGPGQSRRGWLVFVGLDRRAKDLALAIERGGQQERIIGIADDLTPEKQVGGQDVATSLDRRKARRAARQERQAARRAKRQRILTAWRAYQRSQRGKAKQQKAKKLKDGDRAQKTQVPPVSKQQKKRAKRKAKRENKREKRRQQAARKGASSNATAGHRKDKQRKRERHRKGSRSKSDTKKLPWTVLFPFAPRHDYVGLTLGGFSLTTMEVGDREGQRWATDLNGVLLPSMTLQAKSPTIGQHIYGRLGGELVGGLVFRRPLAELAFELGWAFPLGGPIQGFSKAILSTDIWRFPKSVLRCGVHSRAQVSIFQDRHISTFRQAPTDVLERHRDNENAVLSGQVGGVGGGASCTLFSGSWGIQIEGFQINGQAEIEANDWMDSDVQRQNSGVHRAVLFRFSLMGHDGFL